VRRIASLCGVKGEKEGVKRGAAPSERVRRYFVLAICAEGRGESSPHRSLMGHNPNLVCSAGGKSSKREDRGETPMNILGPSFLGPREEEGGIERLVADWRPWGLPKRRGEGVT